jgi:hypothetical protein
MAVQSSDLEIHVTEGMCKVIEGPARRTYFSTSEAVGLALLGMTRGSTASTAKWNDFLATNGVAFGSNDKDSFTIMVLPEKERSIVYMRDHTKVDLKATFPPMVMAVRMIHGKVNKAMFFMLKLGEEKKLTISSTASVLAGFPFGNVYEHGGVCWGTHGIGDLTQPQDVEEAFFGSGFNGDLWYPHNWDGDDTNIQVLVTRTHGKLPTVTNRSYTNSIAGVVQEIGRS